MTIDFDQFLAVDMRVGRVLAVDGSRRRASRRGS